ncbi:hypothetical protein [Streptomyces canus]
MFNEWFHQARVSQYDAKFYVVGQGAVGLAWPYLGNNVPSTVRGEAGDQQ